MAGGAPRPGVGVGRLEMTMDRPAPFGRLVILLLCLYIQQQVPVCHMVLVISAAAGSGWVGGPFLDFFFPAFYVSNEPLQKLPEYPSLSHTSTEDTSEGLLQKQGHLALEWDGRQDACRQGVVGCSAPTDPHSSWELLLRERPPHKAHRGQMTVWTSTGACTPNLRIQVQGGHRMSAGLECLCPPVGRRVTNTTC